MYDRIENADEYGKGACSVSIPGMMALHIKLQRREKGLGRFYTGNPEQFCHRQQAARNVLSKKVT